MHGMQPMHCARIRDRIQDWFDTPGAPAMPDDVRTHVHDCAECRTFIQRWNRIEAGLQTLREDAPRLSADFHASLRSRVERQPLRRARLADLQIARFARPTQFAMGAACAALLLLFLAHVVISSRMLVGASPTHFAITSPRVSSPERGGPSSSLPFVRTP